MTRIILPFIAFACMLSGGSARQSSCSDLRTESTCKDVKGCKWYWSPPPPIPHAPPPYGVCRGTPDKASIPDAYVRLDADHGYEDNGAEVDKITPSARQFRCYDLHTEITCQKVHGCYWIVDHQSHGHSFGSCWGIPLDPDHLYLEKLIPGLIPLGRSAGILDGEQGVKGDEVERTAPGKEDPSVEYVYEYEEEELPNNNDIYVSSGIESSSPRKGNLRAGESNRRWRLLPLDQQQHKV